jgi:hypothetical protein
MIIFAGSVNDVKKIFVSDTLYNERFAENIHNAIYDTTSASNTNTNSVTQPKKTKNTTIARVHEIHHIDNIPIVRNELFNMSRTR